MGSEALPVGALFGTRGRNLRLASGPTRRLNYFQIIPALRGTGFARQVLAAFARFALDAGAYELVVCALPNEKVLKFYEDVGAAVRDVPGWEPPRGLVSVHVDSATHTDLGEHADALEEDAEEVQP